MVKLLMKAVCDNNLEVVKWLLKNNRQVWQYEAESDAYTVLHHAAVMGLTEIVRELLKEPFFDKLKNSGVGPDGWTPLMFAVWDNRQETVLELLKANVDVTIKNAKGQSALDLAKTASHQNQVIIDALEKASKTDFETVNVEDLIYKQIREYDPKLCDAIKNLIDVIRK